MHCSVIFNWLSFLEMWLAYVLSVSFIEYYFVHFWLPRAFNFTLNLHQIIGKLSSSVCVCVLQEWVSNENSPMWFLWASGRVTFEPAYDAWILHMNHQQTLGCFYTCLCASAPSTLIYNEISRRCVFGQFFRRTCLFRECGLCFMCYWERNQCRGSMYFKW